MRKGKKYLKYSHSLKYVEPNETKTTKYIQWSKAGKPKAGVQLHAQLVGAKELRTVP